MEGEPATQLVLPDGSPKASVSQTVGLSDFSVTYHRPGVNKREVWGSLVPYGETWRAGANQNTTLSASTPFGFGGKAVPAGTYGVHMLPSEGEWTVILSSQAKAWEKLRIAVPITVDTRLVTLESVREQMRGLPRFFWQGWNQAASWCVRNNITSDEALAWADRSISMQKAFANLRTKAALLEKKGDAKGARENYEKALSMAPEDQKKRISGEIGKLK